MTTPSPPPQAPTAPPRPKIGTWGDRLAWLGRMPLRYKILFGTQSIIFGMALRFRLMDIERAKRKLEQEKEQVAATPALPSSEYS
mmetsp:Transcript_5982/g.9991  ORF Transcript_5982/g.9991 Transcript_5982/m.9991 type:complete len:85 (+) Transcript_5982:67-321(+)